MFAVEGAGSSLFLAVFIASAFALVALRFAAKDEPGRRRVHVFLLLATLLAAVGMFFTPRAVRIHHILNLYPLPHFVAAAALQALLFDEAGARRGLRTALRAAAGLALAGSLASSVSVDVRTLEEVRSTGGRGRWSDALE